MTVETIDLTTNDGVADAYLAKPEGSGPFPGVLFIMDVFGLRPQIEAMVERIADHGFVVLAPNVFYRAGRAPIVPLDGLADPDSRSKITGQLVPLIGELTRERIEADSRVYLDRLQAESDGEPVAITGYCMGGRVGWNIAAAYPDQVAVLAAFHTGGLVTDGPASTHLRAGEISAELYLAFADNDQSMTAEQIATLEQALDESGANYRSEVYKDAIHGYTMADTASYSEAAAERHYDELFALLDRTISAEQS
jgi:carboxymethylenebutenolidase